MNTNFITIFDENSETIFENVLTFNTVTDSHVSFVYYNGTEQIEIFIDRDLINIDTLIKKYNLTVNK